MDENRKQIWAYLSMKKGMYDNDYYFYEDGTILHCYDLSTKKYNIEKYVLPSDISEHEKVQILTKCKSECAEDIYEQIKSILLVK